MSCTIRIRRSVVAALVALDPRDRRAIADHVSGLAANPTVGSVLKGEVTGLRRIRIGEYRIVYEYRGEEVEILALRRGYLRSVKGRLSE